MRNQSKGIDVRRPDSDIGFPVGKTSYAMASISDCSVIVQSLAYTPRVERSESDIPAGDRKSLCSS